MNPAIKLALLSSSFTPAKLFKSGDIGAFIDPSDISTLYQDSVGRTPVTAAGQSLGLALDKQSGAIRGPELWSDAATTFTGESSKVSAGVYRIYTSDGAITAVNVPNITTAGKTYEVTLTVDSMTVAANGVSLDIVGAAAATTVGDKRWIVVAAATTMTIKRTTAGMACDVQISNVSVREIPGSHAKQATAGSRPLWAAGNKVDYDGVDDSLVITFPSDMGADCTVARSVPNGEATILTAQTITTTYTDSTDHCGLVIINRALTATETNQLRRWLNRRAG